jgi:hypothetical protein
MSSLIKIVGAVIIVSLSFWTTLALLNMHDENLGLEWGVNRGGADYSDFDLPTGASPQVCRQQCLKEVGCRAFAYGGGHCWLKNAVPEPYADSHFVSGVVRP